LNQLGRQSAILVALFAGMIPFSSGASLRAQDVVHIAAGETGKGRTKITCTVLDYTGQSLTLELPGGVQRVFPAERVVQIETTRSKQQTDADKLYERRQYQPALTQYRQALEAEERRWVRREILAQMVWCYRGQGDVASAAQTFLLLVQSDPKTPHFDCIPLAWLPGEPSPQAAQLARQWVDRKDLPAAVLLGASLLIGTADRTLALERLNSLAFDTDARIGWLARA
jgi:tetratricopeptide (TPR) repeat protein